MFELNFWTLMWISGMNMGLPEFLGAERNMNLWREMRHVSFLQQERWFCWF